MNSNDNDTKPRLGPGVTEEQLRKAIERSGYPLQTYVGQNLRSRQPEQVWKSQFSVIDEWSYVDRDTGDLRSIDLRAELRLHGWQPQPRIRPSLNLLIECKQSALPFVFFETPTARRFTTFPLVAGLRTDTLTITSDDTSSSSTYRINQALGMDSDEFHRFPVTCHTLSKCVRKGSELELSGVDAYNHMVLPLVKAVLHCTQSERPVDTAYYFDLHITVPVAVIDAPMISVKNGATLTNVSWVRVLRHEYEQDAERFDRDKLRVIEVVHKDFFDEYLDRHLVPFARRFSERALRHQEELASNTAFVSGMQKDWVSNLEDRLKPSTMFKRTRKAVLSTARKALKASGAKTRETK